MINMQGKKIQGFFIFLMTILALVLTVSPIIQADSATEIYINTIDDLWNIRNGLSGSYILMNDLDFENNDHYVDWTVSKNENTTGNGWLPIGNYDNEFQGTFDGQNYSISNLFINRDDVGIGLFGYTFNSNIKNINLIDVDVTGYDSVGGLVGFSMGYISKCSATGSVTGVYYVGGLVGDNWGSSITKSYAEVQVQGETCVGGLIGSNAESIIEQSYSTGDVNGLDDYDNDMGGLIGYNDGNITNCYATGDVESWGVFSWIIGGLVGENDGGSIANCYSTGFVDGNDVLGGFIGRNNTGTTSTIENCFWDMQTSGQSYSDGGTGKTTTEMKNYNTFNDSDWDIAKIEHHVGETWFINDTNDYPHLGWEPTYISNNPPNAPSNPNPLNGSTDISINADLSWNCTDPDGDPLTFDVYFGTSSPPPLVYSVNTSKIYKPGTMDYNTKYYWKIIAWDNHDTSNSSAVWSFTTGITPNSPPNAPSNPLPYNGSVDVDLNTNISWNCTDPDGDPLTFDVYFGTSSNPPLKKSGQTSTIYDPGKMDPYTNYYWNIVAKDNHGASVTGPIWNFTTIYVNLPPNTPNTPKPSNQSTRIGIYADLSWIGGDPNSNDTVTYDIYFGTNSSPPLEKSNDTNTSYEPGILNYTTTYYWKIIAKDNHGNISAGPIWSFTTVAQSSGGGGGGGGGGSQTPMPIANASASDNSGLVNTAVRFDASYSYHEDGEITNYTWDFGDSSFGYGKITNHIYEEAGTYTVKLTVTDDNSLSDIDTIKVIISELNNPPTIPQIDGPKTGKQNMEYNFTVFSTDLENDSIQYVFNWGDEQNNETDFVANGAMYIEKHKWTRSGIYKIRIYAVDIKNAESAIAETSILIDVIYCKNIGYFIDENSNGIYDLFYSNQTRIKTVTERLENGSYLINNDMDSDWDYIYNTQTGILSSYSPETVTGETEVDNTIFYVLALVVIIVLLLFFAMLGKKPKKGKKIEKEQQEDQYTAKGKPKKETTKKKQTESQKKKSTTNKKDKKEGTKKKSTTKTKGKKRK